MDKLVGVIVQARMGSSRLPGKVLQGVLGKPLLEYELERLKRSLLANLLIVATTRQTQDDPIVALCEQIDVLTYRGSEEDVLTRYIEAARLFKLDIIVRITADCPLIDPKIIDRAIDLFLKSREPLDYLSNCNPRTYPKGMDTEVFSVQALERANQEAKQPEEREHVTLYLYQKMGRFRTENFTYRRNLSSLRLTVDTPSDFEDIRTIIEGLYPKDPNFSLEDILTFMKM